MFTCLCAVEKCFSLDDPVPCLYNVLILYSVKVSKDGMDSLVTLSRGDMRRALNILQVEQNMISLFQCNCNLFPNHSLLEFVSLHMVW